MQELFSNQKLNEFISKLSNRYNLDCIILFGSRARNEHLRKSDIDLLIVGDFREDFLERLRICIHHKPWGIHIDPIPITKSEFREIREQQKVHSV